jgi:hypothetical protein
MIANLSHAVDRTVAMFDQLGVMWGPEARPNLSVHGLSHDQVHELFQGRRAVEDGPSAEHTASPYVSATVRTGLDWTVSFFAHADLACDRCRELVGLPSEVVEAVEAAQLAGIVDRMEGSGL